MKIITWMSAVLLFAGMTVQAELNLDFGDDEEPRYALAVPAPAGMSFPGQGDLRSVLLFKNGDKLHGTMQRFDEDGSIYWVHPDIVEPIRIKSSNVNGVFLGQRSVAQQGGTYVVLSNGDTLYGKIASLDNDELLLETWYGGMMTIKRPMLSSITPGNVRDALYSGPRNIAEWQQTGTSKWIVENERLVGDGTIGRDVGLPEMANIQFDLDCNPGELNLQVMLYAKQMHRYGSDCYLLEISGLRIKLSRFTANGGMNSLGEKQVPSLRKNKRVVVQLNADKENRQFHLFINGKHIEGFVDSQMFIGRGTAIVFHSDAKKSNFSIGNISVAEWDGSVIGGDIGELSGQDHIEFVNRDKVSGTMSTITGDTAKFHTPYATMDIPIERIGAIYFGAGASERARRYAGDVELFFPNRQRLTIKVRKLEDGRLEGFSENFGDLTLNLHAFVGMRFNLYDNEDRRQNDFLSHPAFED